MRERILIAAAIVTSGWLGACSKPTTPEGQDAAAKPGQRSIELAEPSPAERAVVSDLEAGRTPERVLVRSTRAPLRKQPAPAAVTRVEAAIEPTTAHVHTVSVTTSSTPEPVLRLATAPRAPVFGVARAPDGSELHPMPASTWQPDRPTRGPGIIIRGGMGRPDDDCDELNPRGRHGGTAVNRLAPPRMGSVGGSFRGGIR